MKFIWRDDSGKGRSLENLMGERNFMKKMVFIRAMWVENDESKGFFFFFAQCWSKKMVMMKVGCWLVAVNWLLKFFGFWPWLDHGYVGYSILSYWWFCFFFSWAEEIKFRVLDKHFRHYTKHWTTLSNMNPEQLRSCTEDEDRDWQMERRMKSRRWRSLISVGWNLNWSRFEDDGEP